MGAIGGGGLLGGLFGGETMRPSADFVGPMPSSGGLFGGIGNLLGFAEGGNPPVGVPSIVGERGPEIIVPRAPMTVIPGGNPGGQAIQVTNTWNIGGGVTRQELAGLIPYIEARTRDSVFAALKQGGRASQIAGLKS